MNNISFYIDSISNKLENKGFFKEAFILDAIANTLDYSSNPNIEGLAKDNGYVVRLKKEGIETDPQLLKKDIDDYINIMQQLSNVGSRGLDVDRETKLSKNLDIKRNNLHKEMVKKVLDDFSSKGISNVSERDIKDTISSIAEEAFKNKGIKYSPSYFTEKDIVNTYLKAAKTLGIDPSLYATTENFIQNIRNSIKSKDISTYLYHYQGYPATPGKAKDIEKELLKKGYPVVVVPSYERHGGWEDQDTEEIKEEATVYAPSQNDIKNIKDYLVDKGIIKITEDIEKKLKYKNLINILSISNVSINDEEGIIEVILNLNELEIPFSITPKENFFKIDQDSSGGKKLYISRKEADIDLSGLDSNKENVLKKFNAHEKEFPYIKRAIQNNIYDYKLKNMSKTFIEYLIDSFQRMI